jgi:hypothetical protein
MNTVFSLLVVLLHSICSLVRAGDHIAAAALVETTTYLSGATQPPPPFTTLRSSSNRIQRRTNDRSLRILQSDGNVTDRQTDNSAAAFLKCYSLLEETTSSTGGFMSQQEYLGFLMMMTDGELVFGRFADLPALFVMIFYTAACTIGTDCTPGNTPQFEIGDTSDPNETIQLLCQQILKTTFSTAESVFEYSIRYSTDTIDEAGLATCLSTATVNVLLDELAACPLLTDVANTERKKQRRKVMVQETPYNTQRIERLQERRLQTLGSAGTDVDSMCDYEILCTVDRFTELRKFLFFTNYAQLVVTTRILMYSNSYSVISTILNRFHSM